MVAKIKISLDLPSNLRTSQFEGADMNLTVVFKDFIYGI